MPSSIPSPPATVPSPGVTPGGGVGTSAVVRFRERVRARTGTADLLVFRLGDERFAFDVRALDEALEAPHLESVPAHGRSVLAGIARHDDRSVPVFDAGCLLGVRGMRGASLLLMRSGVNRLGLLVDEVEDVETVDLSTVRPAPFDAGDELLLGVTWNGDQLTAILDARALIATCQQRAGDAG